MMLGQTGVVRGTSLSPWLHTAKPRLRWEKWVGSQQSLLHSWQIHIGVNVVSAMQCLHFQSTTFLSQEVILTK